MPEQPTWRQVIQKEAENAGVPPALAFAIVEQESSGNPAAVGQEVPGQGRAQGFFQLMPKTAQGLGVDATDPYQNIKGGVALLKQLHGQFGDDVTSIIAAYHGGPDKANHGPKTEQYVKDVVGRLSAGEPKTPVSTKSLEGQTPPPTAPPAPPAGGLQQFADTVNTGLRLFNPAARFVGGAASEITAPVRMLMHPVDTLQGMKQNAVSEFGEAQKAYQEGNYPSAALHAASTLPPVAEAVDIAKQAYGGDWAGAAGRTAGFLAMPKIVKGAPRVVGATLREGGEIAAGAAKSPILTAVGTGTGAMAGSHFGAPGAVLGGLAGGITAARGGEILHGRAGLANMALRQLLGESKKAGMKVANTGGTLGGPALSLEDALAQGLEGARSELNTGPIVEAQGAKGYSGAAPEAPTGGWTRNAKGERVYTSDLASGRQDIPGRIPVAPPEPPPSPLAQEAMRRARTGTGNVPMTAPTNASWQMMTDEAARRAAAMPKITVQQAAEATKTSPLADVLAQRAGGGNAPALGQYSGVKLPESWQQQDVLSRSIKPDAKFIGELYQRYGKEAAEEILQRMGFR